MAKEKITVTLDPTTLADIDSDARRAGLYRSEFVERALRREHYRNLLARVCSPASTNPGDEGKLRDLLAWQRDPSGSQSATA